MTVDEFINKSDGKIKVYRDFRIEAEREISPGLVVCIPDLHLLEKGHTDDFFDGKPEYVDRFTAFLEFLLKIGAEEMDVCQLGDMFDLWQARWNTNLIYTAYTNILGLMDKKLKPVFVIGNHDIDLLKYYEGETFGRKWRHFSKDSQGKITVIYEHGFQADFFNNQGNLSGTIGRAITDIVGLMEYLEPDMDVILGNLWEKVSRAFSIYNAGLTPVKDRERFNSHEYLNYYLNLMEKYNRGETDDHRGPTDLILTIVGHTHTARLVSRPRGDRVLYLMDCGSWVNGGHEFGLIAGREVAVCQWD